MFHVLTVIVSGDSYKVLQVHQLQEEVGQGQEEEKYLAVKQDNSELVRKIFILEELLRDSELAHIQTKKEEADRIKELESKLSLERKKNEDLTARIEYLEEENESLVEKSRVKERDVTNLMSENEELNVKISDLEMENRDQTQQLVRQEKIDFAEEEKCEFEVSFPYHAPRSDRISVTAAVKFSVKTGDLGDRLRVPHSGLGGPGQRAAAPAVGDGDGVKGTERREEMLVLLKLSII